VAEADCDAKVIVCGNSGFIGAAFGDVTKASECIEQPISAWLQ
jgi:hypothetical protein